MRPRGTARGAGLALVAWLGTVGAAAAHSLPGSVLSISRADDELRLTLEVPLEDLVLAAPDVRDLEDLPVGRDLPAGALSRLDAYLADHVALERGTTALPLSLSGASLVAASNDHVGAFTLVVAELAAPLPGTADVPSLTLFHDAVMHEVRSHDATVYWVRPGVPPLAIAEFRYGTVDGRPRPVTLDVPRTR